MNDVSVGTAYAALELRLTPFEQGIHKSEAMMVQWSDRMERQAKAASSMLSRELGAGATKAAAALGVGLGLAVKKASDFSDSMRNVNSLLQLNEKEFQQLRRDVLGFVGDKTIVDGPNKLAQGLYDIAGSGFKGQQALDILKVSAQGASAGLTDTSVSSKVLTAVLNSQIRGVSDARSGMDQLFQVVNLGVGNFEQLAGSIGSVIGTASKAGVTLSEVGAFMALASRQGQTFSDASNDLLNLITKLIRPSDDAAKKMKELGISYGITALQGKGFSTIVHEIIEKTKGNQEILGKLFPDMQAMRALLTVMTRDGKDYADMLAQMAGASAGLGATQLALNEQMKAPGFQWKLLRKEAEGLAIEIGDSLLPATRGLIGGVRDLVHWFAQLPAPTKEAITQFAAFGAVMLAGTGMAVKFATGIIELRTAVMAATGATGLWSAAVAAVTSPVGLAVTAVALLAGGIFILTRNEKDGKEEALAHAAARQKQAEQAHEEAKAVVKLAAEYEALSKKHEKTKADLARLNELRATIARISPEVVAAWSNEGKAVSLHTDLVEALNRKEQELYEDRKRRTLATAQLQQQAINEEITRNDKLAETYRKTLQTGKVTRPRALTFAEANRRAGQSTSIAGTGPDAVQMEEVPATTEQLRYAQERLQQIIERQRALKADLGIVSHTISAGGVAPMPVAAPKKGAQKVGAGGYDPDAAEKAQKAARANAEARVDLLKLVGRELESEVAKAKLLHEDDLKNGVTKERADALLNARIEEAQREHAEKVAAIRKRENEEYKQLRAQATRELKADFEKQDAELRERMQRFDQAATDARVMAMTEGDRPGGVFPGSPTTRDTEEVERQRQAATDALNAWATEYISSWVAFARAVGGVAEDAATDEEEAIQKFSKAMDDFKGKAKSDAKHEKVERLRDSFGVDLAQNVGYELGSEIGRGIEKAIGSNLFGRALARAFSRQVDRWADDFIERTIGSMAGRSVSSGTNSGGGTSKIVAGDEIYPGLNIPGMGLPGMGGGKGMGPWGPLAMLAATAAVSKGRGSGGMLLAGLGGLIGSGSLNKLLGFGKGGLFGLGPWGAVAGLVLPSVLGEVGKLFGIKGRLGVNLGPLHFAEGGRPPLHMASLVGERGPELFVPDRPGVIVPNHKLSAAGANAINFHAPLIGVAHISSDMDVEDVSRRILRAAQYGLRVRTGS